MFAGIKTLRNLNVNNVLTSILLVAGLTVSLVTRPDAALQTGNPQPPNHPLHDGHHHHFHSHSLHSHAGHIDSLRAAQEEQTQAFSFGELFGIHAITLENFPVEPVAALARKVAEELQPAIQRPIHVVSVNRRERTPVAAVSRNATMCVIVLNTNPDGWAVWNRFFGRIDASERMNVVEMAIAHEIGHCAEREMNGASHVTDAFNPLEGEVFADIFATLYSQQYMAGRAEVAVNTLRALRDEFASAEPTHATGERLKALQPQFESLQSLRLSPVLMAQTAGQLLNAQVN